LAIKIRVDNPCIHENKNVTIIGDNIVETLNMKLLGVTAVSISAKLDKRAKSFIVNKTELRAISFQ
jgi:hypothetical protein